MANSATVGKRAQLLEALLAAGIGVPDPVALISCTNTPEAEFAPMPITAVGIDLRQAAELTVQMVEQRQPGFDPTGQPATEPEMLPVFLAQRASTRIKQQGGRGSEALEASIV